MKLITALLLTLASCGGPVPIHNPETATGGVPYAIKPSKGQIPARAPVFQLAPKGISPTLMGGEVADYARFRAIIWIGNCTATLVSARVIYTAAHCVSTSIGFRVGPNRYTALCMVAMEYSMGNSTADFALCMTTKPITGISEYEVVNLDPDLIKTGDEILLSGYGCERWDGPLDGVYRIGKSKVRRIPNRGNSDYVTGNGSTLCAGDSGGPAWSLKNGDRDKLISINSRSDGRRTSYLSSTSSRIGRRFIRAWLMLHPTARICGVSRSAKNCRTQDPVVPPIKNQEFEIDHKVAYIKGHAKPGYDAVKIRADIIAWSLNRATQK